MNGSRPKIRELLADASITVIVVEDRERLGRMNVELVEALLSGAGRSLRVMNEPVVQDDLVGDMVEVVTSLCARLYGRRSAARREAAGMAAAGHVSGVEVTG
jgi:putative resolvase